MSVFALDASVVAALRKGQIPMGTALALLPLRGHGAAQRSLLKRILKEGLSGSEVAAWVAAREVGGRGIAPLKYSVGGAGKVSARSTRNGKLRVVLEADDADGLAKLWSSVRKRLK